MYPITNHEKRQGVIVINCCMGDHLRFLAANQLQMSTLKPIQDIDFFKT